MQVENNNKKKKRKKKHIICDYINQSLGEMSVHGSAVHDDDVGCPSGI